MVTYLYIYVSNIHFLILLPLLYPQLPSSSLLPQAKLAAAGDIFTSLLEIALLHLLWPDDDDKHQLVSYEFPTDQTRLHQRNWSRILAFVRRIWKLVLFTYDVMFWFKKTGDQWTCQVIHGWRYILYITLIYYWGSYFLNTWTMFPDWRRVHNYTSNCNTRWVHTLILILKCSGFIVHYAQYRNVDP